MRISFTAIKNGKRVKVHFTARRRKRRGKVPAHLRPYLFKKRRRKRK